jgi:hypothetical protein
MGEGCGRDGEKKNVVSKWLAESSQEARDMDVISPVGLGGIGKTATPRIHVVYSKRLILCVCVVFSVPLLIFIFQRKCLKF